MGVQCQILINKAKEGVYRAGQAITGKVRYLVDEPTEYQDVALSLVGKGKVVWKEGSGKSSRTYRGMENYVIIHLNVFNKRPEDTITLDGKYEHPFEFFLPEGIPRSYKDYHGSISYKIVLKFEKPSFFSFNKVFKAEIPVYSYLEPTSEGPIIFGLEKELFAPFAEKTPVINLKAKAEKTLLTPGENVNISYEVSNNTDVEIISVKTELYRYLTYTSEGGHQKRLSTKVENCEARTASIPERQFSSFSCVLPTLPELYSIPNAKVIQVEYRALTTVIIPLPHRNATVELPLLIGEAKGAVEPTVELLEDGEQPPSYWEAMNEGKKKEKSDDESDSETDEKSPVQGIKFPR